MRDKPSKNTLIAIPSSIKAELDAHFKGEGDNWRVSNEAKQLLRDEISDNHLVRELISNKSWQMSTLQGAINVFIAMGLYEYRECIGIAEARDMSRKEEMKDGFCRVCDERVISYIDYKDEPPKCVTCGEFVVTDKEVSDE